ncbi:hypothetical protein RCL_jg21660.t1 [Rhizophagus clarus]|uniref:Uncharacterized protein n=1 Tax=Rhizophagus clarus TaxID=94130 RepID=A0A8H3L1A3_9GLOM|nr:hypothetical protein RCL_jg21660.t1 [Rhizophagus clarus]
MFLFGPPGCNTSAGFWNFESTDAQNQTVIFSDPWEHSNSQVLGGRVMSTKIVLERLIKRVEFLINIRAGYELTGAWIRRLVLRILGDQ